MPSEKEHLDVSALETWLWDATCAIRGATDAPKFKDFILPLVFYKRRSSSLCGCVYRCHRAIWERNRGPSDH
jgi:hypothetical protein